MRDGDGRVERHFVILSFAARWIAGEPKLNEELGEARWMRPAELAGLKTTEARRDRGRGVRALDGRLRAHGTGPRLRLARRGRPAHISPDAQTHRSPLPSPSPWRLPVRRRARIEGGPAPFDNDLQRLAEILGALHYLRDICGANEGQSWRNEMQALIDAEAPTGERRSRMVASFNRGYRGFQQTYRTCTAGGRPRDPPLSRRRGQNLARDHGALRQLTRAD